LKQRAEGSIPSLAAKIMSDITLALLIQDWLKMRGLKWYHDPKRSQLRMVREEPLCNSISIADDHIKYCIPTFCKRFVNAITNENDKDGVLPAADPRFFQKLETILRREERYCHFARLIQYLIDAIDIVWGVPVGIVIDLIGELLDEVYYWWDYHAHK
jgi:hypothetical protein